MHVQFGEYHVSDLDFVAAFDVDAKKVGLDLADAIGSSENNTIKIADVAPTGVTVQRGPTLDGLGKYYRETIEESDEEPVDIVAVLREREVDVLVSYLPVGSEDADKFYASARSTRRWRSSTPFRCSSPPTRYGRRSSSTPACRSSVTTSRARSAPPSPTGCWPSCSKTAGWCWTGPTSSTSAATWTSRTMLERDRLESKKISKTQAVTSNIEHDLGARNVHIGPSDYVQWLDDRKWAYVRLEGRAFGDVPLNLEYKLEVWDSPNSAGVIIDAVRAAKIAKDRGLGGPIVSASAYFMKSPPVQWPTTSPVPTWRSSSPATPELGRPSSRSAPRD